MLRFLGILGTSLIVATQVPAEGIREKLPDYCVPHIAEYVPTKKIDCPPKRIETPRLSLCTYNFTAVTPQVEPEDYPTKLKYFSELPGLLIDERLRDRCGAGNVIPAFQSKEAGIAAWWYWVRKRTNRDKNPWGYAKDAKVSFAMLGQDICGCRIGDDGAIPKSLSVYFAGYTRHAQTFFGRSVKLDELHDLSDPKVRWAIARTMFSHEAGRAVSDENISLEEFLIGIQLAEDHIDGVKIDLNDYLAISN